VFISYASPDTAIARALVEVLEKHGLACWIAPRNVRAGALYADAIVRAIGGARAVVLVLSASSIDSSHVGKEIERASSKKRPIIALRIDAAPLTPALEYFLSESQWVEAQSGNMQAAYAKLIDAIRGSEPHALGTVPTAQLKSRFTPIVVAAVVAIIVAYLVVDKLWPSRHVAEETPSPALVHAAASAAPAIPQKSVAVLPFVDMSERKDQEYFSDGLSEELIDHLAHARDLTVIARTSSFQFKGKNDDVRTIGQRLGVANLLEGSVRTSGKKLRITAQLIRVADGSHLWSETYDRDMGDIFKVQDSIAAEVVSALQATMATFVHPHESRPRNLQSYNAVLRGRYFGQRGTKQDSERGIAAFEEAIRLDPENAIAWSGLSDLYEVCAISGWMRPEDAKALARKAVDRALAIDPDLGQAHRILGEQQLKWNYNLEAARAEFKRARELEPDESKYWGLDSDVALVMGDPSEAVRLAEKLAEANPLNPSDLYNLASAIFYSDRLPEAERAAHNMVEQYPSYSYAQCLLGEVLLAERKPEAALAVMSAETDEAARLICVPDALWVLGRRKEADALLTEAAGKYASSSAASIAESYAMRNDHDQALMWLARAYDNRDGNMIYIRADPLMRNLRGDPRFTALLRKMKLPE
jgi:adenylate cyclase